MVMITNAGAKEIVKSAHNGNVSAGATEAVKEATLQYAQTVSAKASALANHAGRTTVKSTDVDLALKSI